MRAIRGIYPLDGTINCLLFAGIKGKGVQIDQEFFKRVSSISRRLKIFCKLPAMYLVLINPIIRAFIPYFRNKIDMGIKNYKC